MESLVKAGKIAKDVMAKSTKLIKPGARHLEAADTIEKMIKDEGGKIAFPTNISINDVAAHQIPKFQDKLEFGEKDIVKVDIGVHIDGYIADTAITIDLSGEYSDMLEVNRKALDAAIELIKPGASISQIGEVVQQIITSAGYKPIENLSGHELKQYDLHAGLNIPNIKTPHDWTIEEGMVLAIEPFATDGAGHVIESPKPEIFSVTEERPIRMREARMLLKALKERGELPFAARWYAKKFNPMKLALILNQLTLAEIIHSYPPLHDKNQGMVSQFEHTVIVQEDSVQVTTA